MNPQEKKPTPGVEGREWAVDNVLYPRGVDSARVIQVVETVAMRGSGENGQIARQVVQYWSLEGELLAEKDHYNPNIAHPKQMQSGA